jgi:hypothetical protein
MMVTACGHLDLGDTSTYTRHVYQMLAVVSALEQSHAAISLTGYLNQDSCVVHAVQVSQ